MQYINGAVPDVTRAERFAIAKHGAQTYNDETPYGVHLQDVVNVAIKFGLRNEAFLCACWLHDSIEDTTVSYSDIRSRFGQEVAELVFAVTNELGRDREERNKKTYPKIQANPWALLLKLCDRIANVEFGRVNNGKWRKYAEEFDGFAEALYVPGEKESTSERLWWYLAMLLECRTDLEKVAEAKRRGAQTAPPKEEVPK